MVLPVLIIGAGLGGVCLAQALRKNNIPFQLFEQDGRQNFRSQGYRLRVNQYGVDALHEALSPEVFDVFERTCAASAGFGVSLKPNGSLPPPGRGGPPPFMGQSYTVDRSTFRAALLTGLEDSVHFGKTLEHYVIADDKVTAHFADGTTAVGALLVGADGVRSHVRRQYIPNFPALDTGMRIIFGRTPITPEFLAATPEEYHQGMSLISDPEKMPDPYMYWVITVRRAAIPFSDERSWNVTPEEAASLAEKLTETWDPAIRKVVTMQDRSKSSIRSILSAMPDMPSWEPSDRVTLVGDAIHVMPPTGAMGANTALRDAADLARRIADAGGAEGAVGQGLREYEAELRSFAKKAIELSWQGGFKSFGLQPQEKCERITL
ncbi:hypothetical protein N7468_007475 [Penicillium chermesinum]|uniref:FAD-binding domain-containing protein n=1 Tax=Penicillium chermesinum TaxID=63820 RepID=A0A9W9TM80_9EURO|nr:uncharacterized protein N7468_007475 [Penicillium chermesinum]KAJ5226250.1 hypothetical protein N7468_007475 [Penicillium chermesinum]